MNPFRPIVFGEADPEKLATLRTRWVTTCIVLSAIVVLQNILDAWITMRMLGSGLGREGNALAMMYLSRGPAFTYAIKALVPAVCCGAIVARLYMRPVTVRWVTWALGFGLFRPTQDPRDVTAWLAVFVGIYCLVLLNNFALAISRGLFS